MTTTKTARGFAEVVTPNVPTVEGAAAFNELEIITERLGDYDLSEPPELAFGLFVRKDTAEGEDDNGDMDRYTTYTIAPGSKLEATKYESFLGYHENKIGTNMSSASIQKHLEKVCQFLGGGVTASKEALAPVIETIGGIPLKDIAARMSCSPWQVFQRLTIHDLHIMLVGVRTVIQKKHEIAYAIAECPCPEKTRVVAKTQQEADSCSIVDSQLKRIKELKRLLLRIELPNGFNDGQSDVKNLYVRPFLVGRYHELFKPKQGEPPEVTALRIAIAAMPESLTYGQKRGDVFDEDIYNELGMNDRRYLTGQVNRLGLGVENGFGITGTVKVPCPNCFTNTQIDWQPINPMANFVLTKNFLYESGFPIE